MTLGRGSFRHRLASAANDNRTANAASFAIWTLAILAMWIAAVVIAGRL